MKFPIVVAAAAMLSACAAEPPGDAALAVANPLTPVPPVGAVAVMAGTVDHRPVDPRPWADVNERVAPGGDE
ncbi:hypothetical protein [Methylobrevis pamukkalensis]|uniref:Uncharacterized protein n=1 Tax=Methylobrevis pamukkalensis TaxID=1439726 RepID=A0A1E3H6P2_9HYPH|nr:hypothetical protein [Methylobrevis pamukkalensis]ODN71456.1 hypothetical protein A6302_01233 [Methylobrevis pamukkalensis]